METDKIIKEMENRGYTVSDESGVLMFTGRFTNLDESIADIRKNLESLGFGGSWGTKGYPKGKVPKSVTEPVKTAAPDQFSTASDYTQMTLDFS